MIVYYIFLTIKTVHPPNGENHHTVREGVTPKTTVPVQKYRLQHHHVQFPVIFRNVQCVCL